MRLYLQFCLYRFPVYSEFCLDRFPVYSEFCLNRFPVYSEFCLDRFHCILNTKCWFNTIKHNDITLVPIWYYLVHGSFSSFVHHLPSLNPYRNPHFLPLISKNRKFQSELFKKIKHVHNNFIKNILLSNVVHCRFKLVM